jgi:hypothetical protein
MDVVFYLWYCYVMFYLLSLKSHSLGKVFRCSFLITTRKVFFLEVVSWRDMAGMARRRVNYWLIDIPIGRGITPPLHLSLFSCSFLFGFSMFCFLFLFCYVFVQLCCMLPSLSTIVVPLSTTSQVLQRHLAHHSQPSWRLSVVVWDIDRVSSKPNCNTLIKAIVFTKRFSIQND